MQTLVVPQISDAVLRSSIHQSIKESLILNLSVLPDAVFSSLSERTLDPTYVITCMAYLQSLLASLEIEVSPKASKFGLKYIPSRNALVFEDKFKSRPLDYPDGIIFSIILIGIVNKALSLRQDIDYSDVDLGVDLNSQDENSMYANLRVALQEFEDNEAMGLEDTSYAKLIAKWFGDSKPSYISDEISAQISDILEIQYEIVEGIHNDVCGYLESRYIDPEFKTCLLTKEFATLLNKEVFRRPNNIALGLKVRTTISNLFDQDTPKGVQGFISAYQTIQKCFLAVDSLPKLKVFTSQKRPYGLYATASRDSQGGVQFVFSYGRDGYAKINPQEAWWALIL